MGAFGIDAFENDDALDFVDVLTRVEGPDLLMSAIETALDAGYLESPEASAALVACEALAAKNMRPSAGMPPELREWLERLHLPLTEALLRRAQAVVNRVKSDSELADLWGESDANGEWQQLVCDLHVRLNAD